jgi:hypothetical protein
MIAIQAQEGEAVAAVPPGVIGWPDIDLAPLRQHLKIRLDEQAETFRLRFITGGAGQAVTYLRKEAEARAWLADNGAATPMLSAEAAAIGVTVAALADEVVANADQWVAIGSAIEAARRSAKVAMNAAAHIAELVAAAQVDWEALLS